MDNEYEIRGNTAVIFIKNRLGKVFETLIDLDDLESVKMQNTKWYPIRTRNKVKTHYACGLIKVEGKRKLIGLHRFLFGEVPAGLVIDHINHDTLDNRKSVNLRIVTRSENMKNRRPKAS